ncbi:MAG: TIGR01459 family HAD-type hydrolase [Hyphomicrobiaceae bacterium]|nr:TIGR01459 family HAD-type hydrolase [Hyphomicrobiaceae bacterium]
MAGGLANELAPILDGAARLLGGYDVVFCDVWGVLHNGVAPYAAAGEALARFRARGGTVVLVSNSPSPSSSVAALLDRIGVDRNAWDAAITSGDLTRAHIADRGIRRVHHIGPRRDLNVFAGLDVERVELARASAIVCTGVVDDRRETGETYRPILIGARERALPLVCGNPDLVVEVGGELLPCAGAVAALYELMGGHVYWAGKPHAPAYTGAHQLAESLRGGAVSHNRILAIGDAVRTDLAGAAGYGVDCLLIAHGIHRDELMRAGRIDPGRLAALLQSTPHRPVAAMTALAW